MGTVGDGNVDNSLLKEKDAEPCGDTAGTGKTSLPSLSPSPAFCEGAEPMVNDSSPDATPDDSTKIPEVVMRDVSEPRGDEGKAPEAVMMERDESGRAAERSTGENVRSSAETSASSTQSASEGSSPSNSSASEASKPESSASPSSESKSDVDSSDIAIQDAVRTIHAQKSGKSCVSTISKLLTALQKEPGHVKNRKHRVDNLAIKKFIIDVKGGLDLMKAVGFCEVKTDKDVSYLSLEESAHDSNKVDLALALLSSSAPPAEHKEEKKATAAKVMCLGGCGFWGDDSQDNYCSLCFKKKMTGQPTGPAAAAAAAAAAPAAPIRCSCGFFGQKQWNNMCSGCFQKAGGVIKKAPVVVPNNWRKKFRRAILKLRAVHAFMSAPRLQQKVKTRCWKCSKKVGITGIECKCGFIFCGTHRYADEHNCQFDHKARFQQTLRKHIQQVVAKKFETID